MNIKGKNKSIPGEFMEERLMLERLKSEKLKSEKPAFKIMAIANIGQHANNNIGDDKIKHSIKARRVFILIIALPPKN